MQLGGYDTTYLKTPELGIQYIPLVDDPTYWITEVSAVRVGLSGKLGWTFSTPGYAMIASGTTFSYIPQKVFPTVMKALLKNVDA